MMSDFTKAFLLAGLVIFFCARCKEEEHILVLSGTEWIVEKIKNEGKLSWQKPKETYQIVFVNDSALTVILDVNIWYGTYIFHGAGKMDISMSGSTYVCCDSDYANDLLEIFSNTEEIFIKNESMFTEGKGKLQLTRQ